MSKQQKVDANSFKIGDHLTVKRTLLSPFGFSVGFTHHGIYAGDGQVIENRLLAGITYNSLEAFAENTEVKVRQHPYAKFNGLQAFMRADERVGEKNYKLHQFNCEHFVNWCIEDVEISRQVDNVVVMLDAIRQWTNKIPIARELTNLAYKKAVAGHLATNPYDYESSAHFDVEMQVKQIKEDFTGSDSQFIDYVLYTVLKGGDSAREIKNYLKTLQLSKEAEMARSILDLLNIAERLQREQGLLANKYPAFSYDKSN